MIVNLFSPDDSRDNLYLSNYATIQLTRRAVAAAGRRRHHLPRPARLQHAALARSGEDGVAQPDAPATWSTPSSSRTCRSRPGRSASRRSPTGQVFQYTMTTLGRLTDAEQFDDMILKTDADGRLVRLRDVANIELGAQATTRPARSTASRRWRCRSTSCPARTRSRRRQARREPRWRS